MGRLDGLDGLRAIAAVWVVLFHVVGGARSNAYLAVDFFFMLSGYVMARRYEDSLRRAMPGAAWSFVTGRIRRLYPTAFASGLIGLPWLWHEMGPRAWHVALTGLLLIPVGTITEPALNPPIWSVGYELLANGLHALILARLATRGLLALALTMLAVLALHTGGHGLSITPNGWETTFTLLRVLAPYCIGIALYRLWRDTPPFHIPALTTWLIMPAFFILGTIFALECSPWDFVFVLILSPVLIAGGLENGRGSRIARLGGALSFPLYAIHGPVLVTAKGMGAGLVVQFLLALTSGVLLWGAGHALTRLRWPTLRRSALTFNP